MAENRELLAVVKYEAARIDSVMREDLGSIRPLVDPLLSEVLEYGLFNGGKRVRPLLVVMAARLAGCRNEAVYRLASGFEYLHAATLFHDDVIDNAETRRGRPAVNRFLQAIFFTLARWSWWGNMSESKGYGYSAGPQPAWWMVSSCSSETLQKRT